MFKKILVANRGEIACRIIQAAREMGIPTTAIYNSVEPNAKHVRLADEAIQTGADPLDTFLNIKNIVNLALEIGADGIHPGYGFLAENSEFVRTCEENNVTFIGPPSSAMNLAGDKANAKETMRKAGMPVIPGSKGLIKDAQEAKPLAKEMGYPVILKATAGGGGRGIRVCNDETELEKNYALAFSEAEKSFGRGDLILEKLIQRSHHIEFQVLGDKHGNVIHLGERDCSIQRRNQKLIEIAPSLLLTHEKRMDLGSRICKAMKHIGYYNAGTVECLADDDMNVYFMEVNTRVQVEHPISEEITGVDIVKEGIRIAAGMPLQYKQEDITFNGNAIECRITSENPKNSFAPSMGRIEKYHPPGGMGIRVDSAGFRGYEITPYYDSMIAKLIVHGRDWKEAVVRAKTALEAFIIDGVNTIIPYYLKVLDDKEFISGKFNTKWVEEREDLLKYDEPEESEDRVAVIAGAIAAFHR
ncbi:MAG: acetyl-CoA carboxylase biotin carboxylase subunit [Thermoplasmata archaeon]|nr:acetyl-CoA carboxylase biotin carboxylase subunit [Thermoplasmata archaeon]